MAARDHEISSIVEACRLIGSDKITERRKNAENLEKLLSNESYIDVLDSNTDSASGFTWNDLFRSASSYMTKEAEKYQTDHSKGVGASQASKSLRDNQLQLSANCLLNVIFLASKSKPRLDVDLVLDHCLMSLKDPFWLEKFGRDHLTALNREIMSRRSYWSKLKPNLWLSIFLMALKMIRGKLPASVTHLSVATLLNNVMHHGTRQCDIVLKVIKKVPFFIETLNNKSLLRLENHLVVKVWIDSAIQLAITIAPEDRLLLCSLTESTLNTFLDQCHNHLEDLDLFVRYCTLAVLAHHPSGEEIGEPGFRTAGSIEDWQKILRRIHSLTDFSIGVLQKRNRTAEVQIHHLSDNQVSLAVRVARQVFSSSFDSTLEVTRLGNLDDTQASIIVPVAKRKRLISGLSELIMRLKDMGAVNEAIPWIQIATELVSEYPLFPQTHEMKELLDYVVDVTSGDSREYKMMSYSFRLYRVVCFTLCECRHDHKDLLQSSIQPESVSKLWDSVWKCLAAHQCHQEGFLLLATVLHYRLVPAALASQLVKLLARPDRSVPCDFNSALSLAAYLERYKLPERHYTARSHLDYDTEGDRSFSFLLSQWLLNTHQDDIENLLFPLFQALAMKQASVQLNLRAALVALRRPNQFELECRQLESSFKYGDLIDNYNAYQEASPSAVLQLGNNPFSVTTLEDQLSLLTDTCFRTAVQIENSKKISNEIVPIFGVAIRLLYILRGPYESIRETDSAFRLLSALLTLVLKEETPNSRQCLEKMANLFNFVGGSENSLLRKTWEMCSEKLEPSQDVDMEAEQIFSGTVRLGRQRNPSVDQDDGELSDVSIFDPTALKISDSWNVELFRLLSSICCPTDAVEAQHSDCKARKFELLRYLSSHSTQELALDLQRNCSVLRPFCNSPIGALDPNLLVKIVDIVSKVGNDYLYDHEAASAVLDLLPPLSRHLSASPSHAAQVKFVALLTSFQDLLQEDMFGPTVEKKFYRCLAALAPGSWLEWSAGTLESTTGKRSSVALEVLAGLQRPLHSVAVSACQVIHQLFDGRDCRWQDSVLAAFSSILQTQETMDISRSCAILQALSSIAIKSAWAEKTAVVMMLRFSRRHGVDTRTLRRIFELAACELDVDYSTWLESRLGFLVERWFDKADLEHFPHAIYQCGSVNSTVDFIRTYQRIIIPLLFLKTRQKDLDRVAELIGISSGNELAAQHTVSIASKILPQFSSTGKERTKLNDFKKCFEDELQMSGMLKDGFLQLVTDSLLAVYDPGVTQLLFGADTVSPLLGSFCYDIRTTLGSIDHFSPDDEILHDASYQYFIQHFKSRPWEIQQLLVDLYSAYESGCRLSDKQQALVSLYATVELLTGALAMSEPVLLSCAFRSLVFRLGHIIRKSDTDLSLRRGSLVILKELLNKIIRHCPKAVATVLVTITGYITPLAQSSTETSLSWLAIDILEFLLIEHHDDLKDVISQLSPFPNLPKFTGLNKVIEEHRKTVSLEEHFKTFVWMADQLEQNMPVESLEELTRLLGERKEELKSLYEKLEESGIGSGSELHHLICCLIRLTRTKSAALLEAIASALGELGPSDLTTLILQPDVLTLDGDSPLGKMDHHSRNLPILQLGMVVFPPILRYLYSAESVSLVSNAVQVMKEAADDAHGQQFYALAKHYNWPSFDLLLPFKPKKPKADPKAIILDSMYFKDNVDDVTLWNCSGSHSSWLIRLTCALIQSFAPCFYTLLLPVCRLEPDFCQVLLPHLVQSVLSVCDQDEQRILSRHINSVLASAASTSSGSPSLKTLLQVIQHLRQPRLNTRKGGKIDSKWENNFQLELNYLDAARAAQSLSAYFSTIMYTEIWLDRLNKIGQPEDTKDDCGYRKATEVYDLLFDAYTCTGELDGRTGFQALLSSDPNWDIRHYEQEHQWFHSLECRDALASYSDSVQQTSGKLAALAHCGLFHMVSELAGNYGDSSVVKEYQFECAWRLGNWNYHQRVAENSSEDAKPGLQQLLYNSLLAMKNKDQPELIRNLSESRLVIVDQLRHAGSLESCRNIYPALTSLRLLRDLQDVGHHSKLDGGAKNILVKLDQCEEFPVGDFSYSEPVLALRSVLLKEVLSPNTETTVALVETLLQTCRKARKHGNFSVASRCLTQLATMVDLDKNVQIQCKLEKALTEWSRRDVDRALSTLRSLVHSLDRETPGGNHHPIYPKALGLLGQWLHVTRSENPRRILSDFFQKALNVSLQQFKASSKKSGRDSPTAEDSTSVSEARQMLASYADSLYQDVQSYLESREFETQQKLSLTREGRANELKNYKPGQAKEALEDELRRAKLYMNSEITNDKVEFQTLFLERDTFLTQAVENYLIGIREESGRQQNSQFDVRISRLISLWFNNRCNVQLTELLIKWLSKIPSYHFIPVLPQLAARLVVKPNPALYHDAFPKLLNDLVEKCAQEHPHHTLPVILALAMSNRDHELEGSKSSNQHPEEDRVVASKQIIQKLKRSVNGPRLVKLENLADLFIQLANKPVVEKRGEVRGASEGHKMPVELARIKDVEDIPVPTVTIPIRPDAVYKNVIGIQSFEPEFSLVGGINAPKKLSCRGTDGTLRAMLLKGKDDLRQDSVMQQVFTTMNTFLQKDEKARMRRLRIRTYKVVPLSKRSGVLEWCENTVPIGEFLIGKDGRSGAHQRYIQPGSLSTRDCQDQMVEIWKKKGSLSVSETCRTYKELCARFPPVFRHFFLEHYTAPSLWFEKRLSYTRSAAASSMVGYILGLGDRHLSNILIDETSAELIHIDLGIAFDQGTLLPTPETVPFRLTRDIVDGMGVMGVEGIFRKCCEFTMEVMRKNQDSILTLLEVLLYDPLYVWTVTPSKAAAIQQPKRALGKRTRGSTTPEVSTEDEPRDSQVNDSAKRTLVRLGQKLKGVEKGTPLSVSGQVNLLIQQARDPANLARIYHGWKPQA